MEVLAYKLNSLTIFNDVGKYKNKHEWRKIITWCANENETLTFIYNLVQYDKWNVMRRLFRYRTMHVSLKHQDFVQLNNKEKSISSFFALLWILQML